MEVSTRNESGRKVSSEDEEVSRVQGGKGVKETTAVGDVHFSRMDGECVMCEHCRVCGVESHGYFRQVDISFNAMSLQISSFTTTLSLLCMLDMPRFSVSEWDFVSQRQPSGALSRTRAPWVRFVGANRSALLLLCVVSVLVRGVLAFYAVLMVLDAFRLLTFLVSRSCEVYCFLLGRLIAAIECHCWCPTRSFSAFGCVVQTRPCRVIAVYGRGGNK